jgi:hypothetical protein
MIFGVGNIRCRRHFVDLRQRRANGRISFWSQSARAFVQVLIRSDV